MPHDPNETPDLGIIIGTVAIAAAGAWVPMDVTQGSYADAGVTPGVWTEVSGLVLNGQEIEITPTTWVAMGVDA